MPNSLAKNILLLIERRTGNRGWRGMKDWENILIYLCAAETGELDKYFPITKEEGEEYNWDIERRNKIEVKVKNFLKNAK